MADTTGTRLFDLLSHDVQTDVTFNVQGVEVKAHGIVVMSGGGVLKERLLGNKDETIVIKEEVSPDTFKMLIKYIYTDTCDVNDENLFQVTHAAKVFGSERLEKYCAHMLKSKLADSNIVAFASHAVGLDAKENVKVCQEYFRTNTLQVIKMKEFLEISYNVLLILCSSDGIACSEFDLFNACVKWAKRECQRKHWEVTPENQRAALGDVMAKIRFPVMKKEEFEDEVVPLEILTYEEVGRLIVGWRKKEQRTDFSDEFRTEVVQLSITDHRKYYKGKTYPDSKLSLPLSTRVKHLKEMEIFDSGKMKYPAEKFTLAHKGTVLRNEETLASINTPGEQLVIDVHSFDISVEAYWGQWVFPLTVKHSEVPIVDKMILGAVYSQQGIKPDKATIRHYVVNHSYPGIAYDNLYPGSIIEVIESK